MAGAAVYRIIDRLGGGASSEVYRAQDAGGGLVALKIVMGDEAAHPGVLGHLAAQVALSARIDHPGLVRLLDSGRLDDGQPFLAMELVEGPSLAALMAKGPVAAPRMLSIVGGLAETLARIHALGAVHRDVKPGNVLLRGGTAPVLMDLGTAALSPADRAGGGDLVGSPGYLAPEVIAGQEFGGAADMFALGVIFYMMATGRRPFTGTPDEAMARIGRDDPVPLSSVAHMLPPELDALVSRMLAKDPARRPGAALLAAAIHGQR